MRAYLLGWRQFETRRLSVPRTNFEVREVYFVGDKVALFVSARKHLELCILIKFRGSHCKGNQRAATHRYPKNIVPSQNYNIILLETILVETSRRQ